MKRGFDFCTRTVDDSGIPYNIRYKRLREASGKSIDDIAAATDLPIEMCYDLEDHPSEFTLGASLREITRLSSALGVDTKSIFEDRSTGPKMSAMQLRDRIQEHLVESGTDIAMFEDEVGFIIEPALKKPEEMLEWNVDCLRFVCDAIGVDWLSALP
jgi:hypothetical protein